MAPSRAPEANALFVVLAVSLLAVLSVSGCLQNTGQSIENAGERLDKAKEKVAPYLDKSRDAVLGSLEQLQEKGNVSLPYYSYGSQGNSSK